MGSNPTPSANLDAIWRLFLLKGDENMAYVVFQHSGGGTTMSKGTTAYEVSFTMTASTSPGGNAASLGSFYGTVPANAVI